MRGSEVEAGFGAGDNKHNALQLFVWRVFIPLMKMVRAYDLDMLNQVNFSLLFVILRVTHLLEFIDQLVGFCFLSLLHCARPYNRSSMLWSRLVYWICWE